MWLVQLVQKRVLVEEPAGFQVPGKFGLRVLAMVMAMVMVEMQILMVGRGSQVVERAGDLGQLRPTEIRECQPSSIDFDYVARGEKS